MNKITQLNINNVIGIDRARIPIGDNITLICGPNASGKSSALDTLAYLITGHKHRNLSPIKANESLSRDVPAAPCSAELWAGDEMVAGIIDGKLVGGGAHSRAAVIPGAFMGGKPKDRITFLLSACGIRIDAREAVAGISGLTQAGTESIAQRAQIDLDTAEEWCRDQARKRKSRWQAITGEEWGAKKAATWKRRPPEGDVEKLEVELEENVRKVSTLREQAAKLAGEFAAAVAAEQALTLRKPEQIQAALDVINADIARLEQITGTTGTIEPCPHCGGMVVRPATGGALQKAADNTPTPADQQLLNVCRDEARKLSLELSRAQAQLELRAEHRPSLQISEERAAANREAGRLEIVGGEIRALIDTIKGAEHATNAAQAEHVALSALLAAAEELGPEGYRSRKLKSAVAMVNAAMPVFSDYRMVDDGTAVWGQSGRGVEWCSKSEAWRANAALSMALSAVSGATVVLLDEFDVVEPAERMTVLRHIEGWSRPRGIQVIIAATLKGAPNIEGIDSVWMGD